MHLTHLSLGDFRSYATAELPLEPGVTALVGPNGQGKTNLVEAVGYVATLGSHRVTNDAPLVRLGAQRAVVRAAVERGGRSNLVEIEIVPGAANRARINRSPVPRAREVLGLLRTVLFAPEDLALVKGDPDTRRRFLDDLLVARAPRYAGVRSDFDRVLRQRNALLKSAGRTIKAGHGDVRTLDVWDTHLATVGADILAGRLKLVHSIAPFVATAYEQVSAGQGAAGLAYKSSLGDDITPEDAPGRELLQARLLEALAKVRNQELERGVSLVGPHRDDLVISLGPFPAKGFASHGESWSLALALRLASYELLRADIGADGDGEPVLILDDVFAELDVGRRDRLAELVAGAEQVLVTAAVPQDVPEALEGARVDVMAGEVRRVR
ncbi:DNA replication/repair protein RecF [Kineosporia sp. R_H_3]|uniref:DNA replication/repair protein RecF n=1 Tax=Kineosporia sp. R_H_3 TaxID=1961848 RepID=UPI000B4AAA6F|nr:DNA replication/repair protein RecF [Kineosporia sp. R_H_3]